MSGLTREDLAQREAEFDVRVSLLRDATVLQLEKEWLERERQGLANKMTMNKDVLNELRFGDSKALQNGAEKLWVSTGPHFSRLGQREIESLVLQNQVGCKQRVDEIDERLAEINQVFNVKVDALQ